MGGRAKNRRNAGEPLRPSSSAPPYRAPHPRDPRVTRQPADASVPPQPTPADLVRQKDSLSVGEAQRAGETGGRRTHPSSDVGAPTLPKKGDQPGSTVTSSTPQMEVSTGSSSNPSTVSVSLEFIEELRELVRANNDTPEGAAEALQEAMSFARAAASTPVRLISPLGETPERQSRPTSAMSTDNLSANASANANAVASASANVTEKRQHFPPIVVENLPNWPHHFRLLTTKLGHTPNARPFKEGIRFFPKTATESSLVLNYLTEASKQDANIQWHCYSTQQELPTKVALRGLPTSTSEEDIKLALEEKGYRAIHIRRIPSIRGRPGCIFFIHLMRPTPERLHELYGIKEILCMPGVRFEGWRGSGGVAQCHRCQAFGHSSYKCHRTSRCVRCAGEHAVADCPRSKDEPAKCANCGKSHAANYRHCKAYKKEARLRKIPVRPPLPPKSGTNPTTTKPSRAERRRRQRPEEDERPLESPQPTENPNIESDTRKKSKRGGRLVQRRRLAASTRVNTPQVATPSGTTPVEMSASKATGSLPAPMQPPRTSTPAKDCSECGAKLPSEKELRLEVAQLKHMIGSLFNYIQAIAAGKIEHRVAAAEVEAFTQAWGQESTQVENNGTSSQMVA